MAPFVVEADKVLDQFKSQLAIDNNVSVLQVVINHVVDEAVHDSAFVLASEHPVEWIEVFRFGHKVVF